MPPPKSTAGDRVTAAVDPTRTRRAAARRAKAFNGGGNGGGGLRLAAHTARALPIGIRGCNTESLVLSRLRSTCRVQGSEAPTTESETFDDRTSSIVSPRKRPTAFPIRTRYPRACKPSSSNMPSVPFSASISGKRSPRSTRRSKSWPTRKPLTAPSRAHLLVQSKTIVEKIEPETRPSRKLPESRRRRVKYAMYPTRAILSPVHLTPHSLSHRSASCSCETSASSRKLSPAAPEIGLRLVPFTGNA